MDLEILDERLQQIEKKLREIEEKVDLLEACNPIFKEWLPLPRVMKFLNYRPTQMSSFIRENRLVISKVGSRKFVHEESLRKVLENNIIIL